MRTKAVAISDKTSYHEISQSLKLARFGCQIILSLCHLADSRAAEESAKIQSDWKTKHGSRAFEMLGGGGGGGGAVSFQFSQGLLNLMCNNLKLIAGINPFFFMLRRYRSKSYITGWKHFWCNTQGLCYGVRGKTPVVHNFDSTEDIPPISFFYLIMIHTRLLLKMVTVFVNWSLIFGNISYFV